ncbi:MAG: hypothetical protein ACTSQJ_01080 [Promethearchaeota archaeon]
MVAIINNESFIRSKESFEKGNILKTLENYDRALKEIDRNKSSTEYILFLKKILEYCRKKNLLEEEAIVLRALGRTHSLFREHVESLKYHYESLKIQRKLGKKLDVAEGLVFLGEDLEISGNYNECIKVFEDAAKIFHELGKLRKEKEIRKEISRLESFSRQIVEDEYYLQKFNIDRY